MSTTRTLTPRLGSLMAGRRAGDRIEPYPALPLRLRRCIEDALREAWKRVLAKLPISERLKAQEEQITTLLHNELNQLRLQIIPSVEEFTQYVFQSVIRDGALPSYDGKHINKAPDFAFRPIREPPGSDGQHYALFVECKPLTKGRSDHSLAVYCGDEGLGRFLAGEYAWKMPVGMMVAYVRDQIVIERHLGPALVKERKCTAQRRVSSLSTDPVFVSSHSRSALNLCDIEIAHLWLHTDDASMTRVTT